LPPQRSKPSVSTSRTTTPGRPAGAGLVRAFGLTEAFRTARMYTGEVPLFDRARVFGVTSLELG
jgi:hypothetical protein